MKIINDKMFNGNNCQIGMADKKIGFIGLGRMGQPMALNLLKAGFDVTVYNRTRAKAEELAYDGAKVADTPKELAEQADIILTILLDSKLLKEVVSGPDGVLSGIRPNSVLIDMTTVTPNTSRELASVLQERQVGFLEAPVIRGPRGAREGTLMILVGGEKRLFINCHSIFSAMGTDIYYLGPAGMAATAKLINNFISHVNLAVLSEALALGQKAGTQLDLLFEILQKGSANSYVLQDRGPGIVNKTFDLKATVGIADKDLGLVLEFGRELQASTFFPSLARQLQQFALGMGLGDKDASNVIRVFEKIYCNDKEGCTDE